MFFRGYVLALAAASHLQHRHEVCINLLVQLKASSYITRFPIMSVFLCLSFQV